MTSLPLADVSLYELALQVTPQPQPLQLSPTTFKSIVGLLLNFLAEQALPAQVWLKLPQGEAWQAEIDRFRQFNAAPYKIYNLQTYPKPERQPIAAGDNARPVDPPRAAAKPSSAELSAAWQSTTRFQSMDTTLIEDFNLDDFVLEDGIGAVPASLPTSSSDDSQVHDLPLAADSQLKREYFLLVTCPAFYGLVIAHRPRSMRSVTDLQKLLAAEDTERKHPLLGMFSFDQSVIQQVLETGINAAVRCGQASTAPTADDTPPLQFAWADLQQQRWVDRLDPVLMSQLFVQQVQRQEDLWRSSLVQRRQAEALPLLQQENADLLNALRSKDEFIKTMGQELRTPLSTMKTALSLLNSSSLRPPQRQRYMDMLSQECDRQSSLIAGVLDLVQLESTVEQTPMEALRLSDIVPGVVSTYQPIAQEKGVMLGYVVPEDLPPVACLTPWLKQIVIHLLNNSIKFTPQGGQVWVRAKQQGDSIQLEFRDTGIGIASNDLPRIFDRFYRVRGNSIDDSGGVGLGLSIVQQLLLRCGGAISVKSKQGEGSVFNVLLPIDQAGAT